MHWMAVFPKNHNANNNDDDDDDDDEWGNEFVLSETTTTTWKDPYYDIFLPPPFLDKHRNIGYHRFVFSELVGYIDPQRPNLPGWLGHLAATTNNNIQNGKRSRRRIPNCCIVPLWRATPLCALVATESMPKHTPLIVSDESSNPTTNMTQQQQNQQQQQRQHELYVQMYHLWYRYRSELMELQGYLQMAIPSSLLPTPPSSSSSSTTVSGPSPSTTNGPTPTTLTKSSSRSIFVTPIGTFHDVNRTYPNLGILHSQPDVIFVDDFFTHDECDRLIKKAKPYVVPCWIKDPQTGRTVLDPSSRTSTNTNIPQREIPTLVQKLTTLLQCDANRLEMIQVIHYSKGQYFRRHTDGFMGPTTACGFEQSARLVTLFCYLNTPPRGGITYFPKINLSVKPHRGRAVLHFPTTLEMMEDFDTEHEGCPADDDKWLLVTWVWMHPRKEGTMYTEEQMFDLSDDII